MTRIEITSTVAADGTLRLTLPRAHAGRQVKVTVEDIPRPKLTQEEWKDFILRTAGTWQGEFERPEHLPLEEREPLP